jgi:hypothetical protein
VHHVGVRRHNFRYRGADTVDASTHDPPIFDPKIAPFRPAEIAQAPRQSRDAGLPFWIVLGK